LVGQVEAERLRRKALMAQGSVSDWRDYAGLGGEGLSLLLLVVDEAADFAGTQTMKTLVQVARKGRAFGISIVVGTQYPTSDVIDGQVKANLPAAIAFKTRTGGESKVILDRTGAQDLHRKGLALVFTGGEWRTVQTLKVDAETVQALTGGVAVDRSALSEIEAEMVMYAVEELSGAFIINALYEAFKGRVSKYALTRLARQWEAMGWLTEEQRNEQGHTQGRMVTDELARLAMGLPHEREDGPDGEWIPRPRPVYQMAPAPAA
jgi:DNA segregation ATPase FtsK/SpoIIIE-like protein